jgi:anti-sigma B factor antagonist
MKLEKSVEEKYTALKPLHEKIDSQLAPQLKQEFIHLINTSDTRNLILNLSEAKYVDSSGLSAILTGNRICKEKGGLLILCHLNEHVEKLIKISRLEEVLMVLPTEEEAREHVFMQELENEITGGDD